MKWYRFIRQSTSFYLHLFFICIVNLCRSVFFFNPNLHYFFFNHKKMFNFASRWIFWAKIPFLVKIHLTQNNQTKEQAAHEFVHECRTQLCQKFKYVSRMKLNSGYCKKYWTHSAVAMTLWWQFWKKNNQTWISVSEFN